MSASQVVAVTGASGFLGTYTVIKLLEEGYTVRMLARGPKADALRESFAKGKDRVQVITVSDIATDDLGEAFTGAWAVIHTASPLAGRADAQTQIKTAIEGTKNVLQQAVKYGVKKAVVTETWASTVNPGDYAAYWSGQTLKETMWGEVNLEDVKEDKMDFFAIYCAAKLIAEKALWKFAEEHKEIDIATINPPFFYGPWAREFPLPSSPTGVGSNVLLLRLITGEPDREFPKQYCGSFIDIRDVAVAHVRALKVPASPDDVQKKRYLVEGGGFTWKDAVQLIAEKRPELKGHLPDISKAPPPRPISLSDVSRAKKDLGIVEYISWEQSVLDTVDDLVRAQKTWGTQ